MSYKLILQGILIYLFLSLPITGYSQQKTIKARLIEDLPIIDGDLNESFWQNVDIGDEFIQFFPTDSLLAQYDTNFKVAYSKEALFIGVTAYSKSEHHVISSLKRDFDGTTNDNVSLLIDTFNDATTAFFFGVTPYGVQREGLVSDGGVTFNDSWDIKWQAETKIHSDYYTIEISIPFTSLKFIEGATSWRFRLYRWNIQNNEQTTWIQVPQNQPLSSLAYMGSLEFEEPLGRSRSPLFLIPYTNVLKDKDFTVINSNSTVKVGIDAKVSVSDAMNLDLTLNPDFSSVEVDNVFTNLTRFEILLPERRQFFIDNNDLFSNYGSALDNTPFFSRRVGIIRDQNGNLIENKIIGGIRLSGKLNESLRMGILSIQSSEDEFNNTPSFNNSMISFQRRMFSRSNLGMFLVNRQVLENSTSDYSNQRFNRVVGIDYDLASKDNVWRGNFFVHKSFQPDDNRGNLSAQSMLFYDTRDWRFVLDAVYVDQDYQADLGFVPRKDVFKTGNSITRRFYPKNSTFSNHNFMLLGVNFWRPSMDYKHTDYFYRVQWQANFSNQSTLTSFVQNNYIYLINPFDPSRRLGSVPLPGNSGYRFNQFSTEFRSSPSNTFTYSLNTTLGNFYNGNQYSIGSEIRYRVQPFGNLSLGLNYDGIRLPDPYSDADIWLGILRTEITFSKSLFWNTTIQYSNQRNNLGINTRLQWRFAPLSDLFLVYNDNYFTDSFAPNYRSLNLKLTYWLNM